MPDVRKQQLKALRDAEAKLHSLDDATANRIANMYDAVRRKLLADLTDWYQRMGAPTDPLQLRVMAADVARIKEIDRAIAGLSEDVAGYLRDQIPAAQSLGLDNADREVQQMARALHISNIGREAFFTGLDQQLALMVDSIVGAIPGLINPLAAQLKFELQYSLTQGDSFDQIVQRLLAADLGPTGASFFRRGQVSMQLFSRRSVIDSNNSSRQLVYEKAQQVLPRLQKQAIAAIDGRTTDCCLRVHGQIVALDKPYHLSGTPRFQADMMFPAFHWNCRTTSVSYMPEFEEGSLVTTVGLKDEARAEIDQRAKDGNVGATT